MDDNYQKQNAANSDSLTSSEQMVLYAVKQHKASIDDLPAIAKVCRLSEMQASVAVQLLTHKKLIPPQ